MSKKSNNISLKGLYIILLYMIFSILLEMVSSISLGFGVLPTYIVFDLAFLFIISGILYLIRNDKAKYIIASILLLVQVVLNIANNTLFDTFGVVFHLKMLTLGAEATAAFSFEFLDFGIIAINLLVWLLFLLLAILLDRKYKNSSEVKTHRKIALILACFLCFETFGLSFAFFGNSTFKETDEAEQTILDSDR